MITIDQFEVGKKVEGFFMVKSVDYKITNSNNKKYLDFVLGDKTGEINAKLWEVSTEDENRYNSNMIIKVRGTILSWQNSLQFKIDRIRPCEDEDNIEIEEFVISAPYKAEVMYEYILSYVNNMENVEIKNLVTEILQQNVEKIMHYPAAKKNHHAIRAGLLYHIYTMLRAGENFCQIYTTLNRDLLFGGIILHDMAKIQEMNASEYGIVDEYTIEGQLLGHITQGIKSIEIAGEKLGTDKEVLMLIQHMILSHHYQPEYGSPVKPMIPEAEILHYLDIIDARMFDMNKAYGETNPGEFSSRIWSLENRRVYKPVFNSMENL